MLTAWIIFFTLVLGLLALDLFVFHRTAHEVKMKEALGWSAFWITLSLIFNGFIYILYEKGLFGLQAASPEVPDGRTAAILFFTGYIIEKSLSVDNVFVIALIFSFFQVPLRFQHRVLFWGILGALIMRGIMIGLGAALITRFHWILYIFGALLLVTAGRMLFGSGEPDPATHPLVRLIRRFVPLSDEYDGQKLITKVSGKTMLTPLGLCLIVIESMDLMFAIDSVPAVFAVTQDAYIVFTCNVFAVLGLRALYFALAGVVEKFHYLKMSLAVLLALIGVKMLLKDILHTIPNITLYTLGAIALILGTGIVASLVRARRLSQQS